MNTTAPTAAQEAAGKALHATNPERWPKPLPWEALTRERQLWFIRLALKLGFVPSK